MKLADVQWAQAANEFWEYYETERYTFYRRTKSLHEGTPLGELRVMRRGETYDPAGTTIDELEMQALLFELHKLPDE